MKINVFSKILIGSMALSSCQKPAQHILYNSTNPIVQKADCFISSTKNPEKTFDLLKDAAKIFTGDFSACNMTAGTNGGKNSLTNLKTEYRRIPKQTKKNVINHSTPMSNTVEPTERELSPTKCDNYWMSNENINGTKSSNYGSYWMSDKNISCANPSKFNKYWISGKNISYVKPTEYTIEGAGKKWNNIASENGVSMYRLKLANPDLNFEKSIPAGTIVKIPERYIVTPGSVKSFDDVVKTTKISQHYINDILICIEGRKQKPDLVCKSDRVKSKLYPNGCPTIGFGHTGRVDGKVIVNGVTKITEEKAYELLAQDILDAKLDAMTYMGKDLFEAAPASIQTGIIDIVFNKGVEPFTRHGSPTTFIKRDLEAGDYAAAAAHTVLKTGNRGLKKRNVYRVILATDNLSETERIRSLNIAKPHFIDTLKKFPGRNNSGDRNLMQKAWANAKNGVTNGFFNN